MRKLWMILCLAVLVSSAFAQDYKVLDRSEKRRPDWVGRSGDEAIALGAEKATLEEARQACMQALRMEIISSIAINVYSESSVHVRNVNATAGSEFTEEFINNSSTQSAVMPFLTNISAANTLATYWEKRQDKKTHEVSYEYCMLYPFPESVRNEYLNEFLKIDREMVEKTEALNARLSSISSVEDIDRGSVEIKECVSYFFDKRRKAWAEGIAALYRKAPSKISLHGKQADKGAYRVWLEYDGRKITPSGTPTLKSDCAENLQFSRDGQDYLVTFSTENCLEDEPRSLGVAFRIKAKNIKQKFVIE